MKITYKFGVGLTCCSGYKLTIYKVIDGETEVLETTTNFDSKEKAKEFAIKRIEELKEKNGT